MRRSAALARAQRRAALRSGMAATVALLGATAAAAHHSFSMFDMENNIRIDGVVAEVQWTNPHAWMEVDVPDTDGGVTRWGVEFNSPNNLIRQGWKRTTIRAGDHVSFVVSPLRDGQPGGLFYEVTLPSGEILRDPRAEADLARHAQAETEAGAQE
jgi:hypothetical protein